MQEMFESHRRPTATLRRRDVLNGAGAGMTLGVLASVFGAALPAGMQVGTTLRYLMYHDSYGERESARQLFAKLPAAARRLEGVDFSQAAARCPHKIDIAKHMQRAAEVLA